VFLEGKRTSQGVVFIVFSSQNAKVVIKSIQISKNSRLASILISFKKYIK